jgi:hypothetical protein
MSGSFLAQPWDPEASTPNVSFLSAVSYSPELWGSSLYHLRCSTAAAIALLDYGDLSAEDIVRKSMKIAGDICVYTNHNLIIEKLEPQGASGSAQLTAETTTSTGTDGAVSDAVGTAGPTSPGTSVGTMDAKASP